MKLLIMNTLPTKLQTSRSNQSTLTRNLSAYYLNQNISSVGTQTTDDAVPISLQLHYSKLQHKNAATLAAKSVLRTTIVPNSY